jgi:hypothetical protein
MPERRRMMQAWSDYLDQLKSNLPGNKPMRATRNGTNMPGVREASVDARRSINLSRQHA